MLYMQLSQKKIQETNTSVNPPIKKFDLLNKIDVSGFERIPELEKPKILFFGFENLSKEEIIEFAKEKLYSHHINAGLSLLNAQDNVLNTQKARKHIEDFFKKTKPLETSEVSINMPREAVEMERSFQDYFSKGCYLFKDPHSVVDDFNTALKNIYISQDPYKVLLNLS
ncbi:hypothetical protein K9L16_02065 [Candidatus Pacearchaeota archaeon]|nr:hypothetical protein [Candidatus Pacearchaeota archaeon]